MSNSVLLTSVSQRKYSEPWRYAFRVDRETGKEVLVRVPAVTRQVSR